MIDPDLKPNRAELRGQGERVGKDFKGLDQGIGLIDILLPIDYTAKNCRQLTGF